MVVLIALVTVVLVSVVTVVVEEAVEGAVASRVMLNVPVLTYRQFRAEA